MTEKSKTKAECLSPAKWQKLLDEWVTSGLTQSAFCKLKGINRHTFSYWRGKKHPLKKLPSERNFLPAKIKTLTIKQPATQTVTLRLPNGISLQIPLHANKSFVKDVFELLGVTAY